jgi:hypothetical protein
MTNPHVGGIARQCITYLSSRQPDIIQQHAISLYESLMIADANIVWWYLRRAADALPSSPTLYQRPSTLLAPKLSSLINYRDNLNILPVPATSSSSPTREQGEYTTNVDVLLRRLQALPEPQLTSFW